MTRYEEIEQRIARNKKWASRFGPNSPIVVNEINPNTEVLEYCLAALALPEDSKTVNAELYVPSEVHDQIMEILNPYLDTGDSRTAPDWAVAVALAIEPMPYKVVRDGGKVRFE